MDDFFKSMRDQLENRPEPEFQESAWEDLSSRLDAHTQSQTIPAYRRYGWAALLFLLLGSTLCNYWFYRQLQAHPSESPQEVMVYRTDTVHHTRHIFHTDTIFQTRLVKVPAPAIAITSPPNHQRLWERRFVNLEDRFRGPAYASSINLFAPRPSLSLFSTSSASMAVADANNEDDSSLLNRFTLFYGLPQAVDELETPEFKAPDTEVDLTSMEQKKSFGKRLVYAMKPKRFYVGPTLGGVYPVHSDLKNQKGFALGIQAMVSFSDRFRVWAEATYLRVAYTTTELGSLRGIPAIDPPSDNFTFVNAGVPQPSVQYSAGIHYNIISEGKWRPYAAIGLSTLTLLPFEVTYKFEDIPNGLELTLEQKINRKRQFSQHTLVKFGLETHVHSHWSLQLESLYRLSLETQGATNTNLFGLRVGALYRF